MDAFNLKVLVISILFSNGDCVIYEISNNFLYQYTQLRMSNSSEQEEEILFYSLSKDDWLSASKISNRWVVNIKNRYQDDEKYFDEQFKLESKPFKYKDLKGQKILSTKGRLNWIAYYLEIKQLQKLNANILKHPLIRLNKYISANLYRVQESAEMVKPVATKVTWENDFSEEVRNTIDFERIQIRK